MIFGFSFSGRDIMFFIMDVAKEPFRRCTLKTKENLKRAAAELVSIVSKKAFKKYFTNKHFVQTSVTSVSYFSCIQSTNTYVSLKLSHVLLYNVISFHSPQNFTTSKNNMQLRTFSFFIAVTKFSSH